jgi:DNA-3-methyladenine glycosylase II
MKLKKIKNHFKKVDPIIHGAMADLDFAKWLQPREEKRQQPGGYFAALCREIVGQQLSGKVARVIFGRLVELFPEKTINPQLVSQLEDQQLRDVGLSWGKVSYIKDLAAKTLDNTLQLDDLEDMSDEEVIDHLTQVKGIGPWTGEMFLMFSLGREDVFSHGDLGLKKGIEKLYQLPSPSFEQINKITEPWRPYRSYGSITLWHGLDNG